MIEEIRFRHVDAKPNTHDVQLRGSVAKLLVVQRTRFVVLVRSGFINVDGTRIVVGTHGSPRVPIITTSVGRTST